MLPCYADRDQVVAPLFSDQSFRKTMSLRSARGRLRRERNRQEGGRTVRLTFTVRGKREGSSRVKQHKFKTKDDVERVGDNSAHERGGWEEGDK